MKKNEVFPFAATCMDLENIIFREVSQTVKDRYYMISFIVGFKKSTNESIYKTLTEIENKLMVTKREREGEG